MSSANPNPDRGPLGHTGLFESSTEPKGQFDCFTFGLICRKDQNGPRSLLERHHRRGGRACRMLSTWSRSAPNKWTHRAPQPPRE